MIVLNTHRKNVYQIFVASILCVSMIFSLDSSLLIELIGQQKSLTSHELIDLKAATDGEKMNNETETIVALTEVCLSDKFRIKNSNVSLSFMPINAFLLIPNMSYDIQVPPPKIYFI